MRILFHSIWPSAAILLSAGAFMIFLLQAQEPSGNQSPTVQDQGKKKKGAGTPVVNAQELPFEVTPELMEVLRTSLGIECNYCHVSGDFQERGHVGDRQNDANPRKLIARDMIKMTKEINKMITGIGEFPHPSNVVTCWTCHRGNRRPVTVPPEVTVAVNPAAN